MKRYHKDGHHTEHPEGKFVLFEDANALERRVEELETLFDEAMQKCHYHEARNQLLTELTGRLDRHCRELIEVIDAAFDWIDAVPPDTVLPAMPGFDREWADSVRFKDVPGVENKVVCRMKCINS